MLWLLLCAFWRLFLQLQFYPCPAKFDVGIGSVCLRWIIWYLLQHLRPTSPSLPRPSTYVTNVGSVKCAKSPSRRRCGTFVHQLIWERRWITKGLLTVACELQRHFKLARLRRWHNALIARLFDTATLWYGILCSCVLRMGEEDAVSCRFLYIYIDLRRWIRVGNR